MNTETNKTYRIAVVGHEDIIAGFQTLGVDTYFAEDSTTALEHIKNIRRSTLGGESGAKAYGVIMVIDELLSDIPEDEYARITQGALPAILSIPSISSDPTISTQKLRKMAEKAVGSDILS